MLHERFAAARARLLARRRVVGNPDEQVLVVPRASIVPGDGWLGVRRDGLDEALAAVAARRVLPAPWRRRGGPDPQAGHPVPRAPRRRAVVPHAPHEGRRRRAAPRPVVDRRRRAPQPGRRRRRGRAPARVGRGGRRGASSPTFEPVGLLNDDTTPVGAVHVGIVFVADAAGRPVEIRETDKLSGSFATTDEVAAVRDAMETWSRLVFDALTDARRPRRLTVLRAGAILDAGHMDHSTRSIRIRLARTLALLGVLLVAAASIARGAQPQVVLLTATGTVDGVLATYLEEGIAAGGRRRRRGGRRGAQHAGRQPRRHAADHGLVPRGGRAGDRVGGARRRPGGERRDVHHARREPRVHGARDEHRRGVAGVAARAATSRARWATRSATTRSRTSRRSPSTAAGPSTGRSRRSPRRRATRRARRSPRVRWTASRRRSTRSSPRPTARR